MTSPLMTYSVTVHGANSLKTRDFEEWRVFWGLKTLSSMRQTPENRGVRPVNGYSSTTMPKLSIRFTDMISPKRQNG